MTRKECEQVLAVLIRIKQQDPEVLFAQTIVKKQLAAFDARKGQLREQYDYTRDI